MAVVQKSPLLNLAAELRNAIYSEVLIEPGEIKVREGTLPPLVQTCRQVRADTLKVYYANNTFRVGEGDSLRHEFCYERHIFPWLSSIEASAVKTLSKVWLDDKYYNSSEDASEALVMYTKLLVSAGLEVAREALFVEARVIDKEGDNLGKSFWTSDPGSDFASAWARIAAEEVKKSPH
ncbi:hypothetical protein LTS10_012753 [Elasticomyces elasticus]|nr:hypothetical protein LTS10_012753 [Elasticomyces elasticus]